MKYDKVSLPSGPAVCLGEQDSLIKKKTDEGIERGCFGKRGHGLYRARTLGDCRTHGLSHTFPGSFPLAHPHPREMNSKQDCSLGKNPNLFDFQIQDLHL